MGVKEKKLINELMLLATSMGNRLFRNNVGMSWVGTIIHKDINTLTLSHPRPFHSGLAKGSSDLIGWTTKLVTQDMVGKKIAVFTAYEVKTKNLKSTPEQEAFINIVNDSGGIAKVIRKITDI